MSLSGHTTPQSPFSSVRHPWRGNLQRHLILLVILAVTCVPIALPVNAIGQSGYKVHPGGIDLILPVYKTSEYTISVSANERQQVQLVVTRDSSVTEYTTTGRVSSQAIHANFGVLGRVSVKLHLAPHPSDPPHKGYCKGRAPSYQTGTYSGAIEFIHKGDVPKVLANRGRAYFTRRFKQICVKELPAPPSKSKLARKIEVALLTLRGKAEGRTILLRAVTLALKRRPTHSFGRLAVATYEKDERVRISKSLNVPINGNSFAMSRRGTFPETIKVGLSLPFAGHALYSSSPGSSPEWTGDFNVTFPGVGEIPLTGSAFHVMLCRRPLSKVGDCGSGPDFRA